MKFLVLIFYFIDKPNSTEFENESWFENRNLEGYVSYILE